ncbi:hypothetical protein Tco_0316504 [Tanacetum coccineum]
MDQHLKRSSFTKLIYQNTRSSEKISKISLNDFEDLFLSIFKKTHHLPKTDKISLTQQSTGRMIEPSDQIVWEGLTAPRIETGPHGYRHSSCFEYKKGMETRKWSEEKKQEKKKDFIHSLSRKDTDQKDPYRSQRKLCWRKNKRYLTTG